MNLTMLRNRNKKVSSYPGMEDNKKQILVIDDEKPIREFLKHVLEQEGFSVTQSWCGNDGLKKFHNNSFDIVITDIAIPDINGVQIIIKMRESRRPVKIIAMSGAGKFEYLLRIAEFYKVDATIAKPFVRDEVLSVVRNVLNDYRNYRKH